MLDIQDFKNIKLYLKEIHIKKFQGSTSSVLYCNIYLSFINILQLSKRRECFLGLASEFLPSFLYLIIYLSLSLSIYLPVYFFLCFISKQIHSVHDRNYKNSKVSDKFSSRNTSIASERFFQYQILLATTLTTMHYIISAVFYTTILYNFLYIITFLLLSIECLSKE